MNKLQQYKFTEALQTFEFIVKTINTSAGSSGANQFKLPLINKGVIDLTVQWGDGTVSRITTWNQSEVTHTYSSSGTYLVKIIGKTKGFRFNNSGDKLKLMLVNKVDGLYVDSDAMFFGCVNMSWGATSLPSITTSNLSKMFYSCSVFDGDLSNWDISNVTNISEMFAYCSVFNSDISSWNTSNITTIYSIFFSCAKFNKNVGLWDMSKVTEISYMFNGATNFNQNISNWDVSKVTAGIQFMQGKTSANYSASNLDAIYNKWSLLTLKPSVTISFGSIKRTSASTAGKVILTSSPNNWIITDGGI